MSTNSPLQGEIPGYDAPLTLEQLCRSCGLPREQVLLLVEEGIIEPQAEASDRTGHWHFHWKSLTRVRTSTRLQRSESVV